ncbi:MAG TPA: MOFRL family protein, partial [Myxococcota bacterium]|nr:MOFRL family protein [Myxococcota bacterium]
LAAGTDGVDGPTEAAGAYADGATRARGRARGLDARACLDANDSHTFFQAEGGLFVTGPTRTNAMDLALVRIEALAR